MLAQLCRQHTEALFAYFKQLDEEHAADGAPRIFTTYDGTVLAASRIYQEDKRSDFHGVKHNTRQYYLKSLKLIEATVGKRLIRNLTVFDVKHWYNEWRKPAEPGGPERIDRAHDAVTMFRTVLNFMAALRHKDCALLADELKKIRFEKGSAREEELTYKQASAFIRTAFELAERGVITRDRALYMAIGTAAQFEMILRQKDIIGEYLKTERDLDRETRRARIDPLRAGDDWWLGYFTWERIPGWRWRMKTSKSKYRSAVEFDLQNYGLLFPLLELVPARDRHGAIVKGPHGLPFRQDTYGGQWRKIARAAGIPDEVWNMDARAGGATEAEEANAAHADIQAAMTHEPGSVSTVRYIRRQSTKAAAVARARQAAREADQEASDGKA